MAARASGTAAAAALAAALSACCAAAMAARWLRRRARSGPPDRGGALLSLIGNTPLIELRTLSARTGCRVYAKCEFLNPGGSSKDRVAAAIVAEAEATGALAAGGTVVEATAGSTGVSLAMVARARGYRCLIVAPDDTSEQKLRLIRALGADLEVVRPAPIADASHAVNVARRRAAEREGSVYCDQFNHAANSRAHEQTGREVWEQTHGQIDAFVMGAGTGGTIAGVSRYLKARKPSVQVRRDPHLTLIPRPLSNLRGNYSDKVLTTAGLRAGAPRRPAGLVAVHARQARRRILRAAA